MKKQNVIKHSEFLKYKFSETELRTVAQDLARENQELENIEREKAQANGSFKHRASEAQTKIAKFSAWIREGCDFRMIECETLFHTPTEGQKSTFRLDTGELVKTVKMTDSEKQDILPFTGKEGTSHANA